MDMISFFIGLVLGVVIGVALSRRSARSDSEGAAELVAEKTRNEELKDQLEKSDTEKRALENKVATASENLARADERIKAHEDAQKIAKQEFENLANRILKETGADFKKQSTETLENLLNPLGKNLEGFQKELTAFRAINDRMTSETESLTKALTSNVKAQGNWGEFALERILEESGLEKDRDYILQGQGMELKSATGGRQMPDVVVKLPEGRHIVIDAKVTLNALTDYHNAQDDETRTLARRAFISSVESHIKNLASKDYAHAYGLKAIDFVMMFMPMESAYHLLFSETDALAEKAWEKRIAIVSPITLLQSLTTIGYIWRVEKQNQNAEEIARLGGAIYDKIYGFLGDMETVGKNLDRAQTAHSDAIKKLSDGRGNVLSQTEKLKELGSKTTKSLPDLSQD